ncbi:MAG: RNase P subunit p30 family protein [Candidatus Nanoarchaeia archaeon]
MKFYDFSPTVVKTAWYGFKGFMKPVIITAKSIKELKNKTAEVKGFIVLKHPDEKVFRHAIEKSLVDAVLPNRLSGHDYFHHRWTLIDNVAAKIMSHNKVCLLFTFNELRSTNGQKRALVWGRMKQEIMICVKKKVPIIISSGAEKEADLACAQSLLAMGELLGLKPDESKKALNYAQEKIISRDKVSLN